MVCSAAALGLAIGGYFWFDSERIPPRPDKNPPRSSDRFRLPDVLPARFRNASTSVEYVGNRACVECHPGEHETYLKTTHSRSLADIDVSREPPSAEFHHELSGRHYRVYRAGPTLRMSEFVRTAGGEETVLVDVAVRYVIGSGNYARSYLVQSDDFLIEAPLTWYPHRNRWGMSAGYEKDPLQMGFSREIGWGCMNCHTGRTEQVGGADLRMKVVESAISCERCHGPGGLHVKERRAIRPIRGSVDDSIVNLRHLSRERQEDVCAQCHLSSLANVDVRGRSVADFRPGMRMSDFRVSYRIDRPGAARTVSGQIEQMRLSRCYTESKTMTCTTCHDPHALPKESEKVAYFRGKCLNCHDAGACRAPVEVRHETKPADNCMECHMPKGPTDIPHLSFSHHYVGIHPNDAPKVKYNASDQLIADGDISHWPKLEQLRLLGAANDIFAGKLKTGLNDESRGDPAYRALGDVFQNRARLLLEKVRDQGLKDPEVEVFFSRLSWRKDPALCIAHSQSALESKHLRPELRRTALYNLASTRFDLGQYDQAMPSLQTLVTLEPNEIPLMLLGICYQKQGNLPEAVRLFSQAILAEPTRADLHTYLASVYRQMGKHDEAEKHLKRARLLSENVPQFPE